MILRSKQLFCSVMAFLLVFGSINLSSMGASTATAAVVGGYDGKYLQYGVVDLIDLGNEISEQAHQLVAPGSQSVIGAEGETARVSLPKDQPDYFGGDITFNIKVDPDDLNYFTLKLWGSDASEYRCFLTIDNQVFYPAPLVIAKMAEEAPIENRFYFSTIPIPLEKTKGKTELTVTLRTASTYYPYSAGTFSKAYQEKMNTPSNKYYMGYVHNTASLAEEVIRDSGAITSYVPPVRDNGDNGSDLDPNSLSANNMTKHIYTEVETVLRGVLARNTSTNNFTTATWSSADINEGHGSGTMMPPYSQNDVNLYNLKYVSEALLDNDSPEYDALVKELGVDNLLNALIGAMDRVVINYLNKPGTIQVGGHQSSWGGFYQGLGESLWNVNLLFATGRYEELGGSKYQDFNTWFDGTKMINWKDTFSTVAKFYHQPEQGKSYPFLLDKAEDEIGTQPYITTRKAAYEEILWLNYNYARTHAYTLTPLTNQVMFQMYGAFKSNAGLIAIDSELAENYKSSLRQLFRSSGVLPYYDIDVVHGSIDAAINSSGAYTGELIIKNVEAFNNSTQFDSDRNYIGEYRKAWGLNYYMVTAAGLTRETTYAAGYGDHSDMIVSVWRMVKEAADLYEDTPGIKLADETELLRKALLAINARSHMKYQDVDEGYRSMRLEATIEARGPFYPYDAGYMSHLSPTGKTTVQPFLLVNLKAEIDKNPEKYKAYFGSDYAELYSYAEAGVAYTQQMLEDNQLTPAINRSFGADLKALAAYKYMINEKRIARLIPSTNLKWYSDEEIAKLKQAGFDEDAHYNHSFYDIEDSIVYFRDEDTVYSLAFEYKSDSGLTGLSRIHATSSDYDRIAMLNTEVRYTPSGAWNFTVPWTTVMYNLSFDPVTGMPDGSTNLLGGQILPVSSWKGYDQQINLTHSKSGSPFGGYAEFYSARYGQYVIAMNTTRASYDNAKDYEVILPSTFKSSTIYDKMTNTWLTVRNGKVKVPAFTAVALDLETDVITNDIPSAPIFATGVAAGNKVALTWTHAAGTDGVYQILRSASSDGTYSVIDTVDKNTNLYIDESVTSGETYYYKIRGVNLKGLAGNPSAYAKVLVSLNNLGEEWSFDSTVWGLDKEIKDMDDLTVAMEDGNLTFTGNKDESGNLLFAYTNNLSKDTDTTELSPINGDFEFLTEIKSGEEIGIMFKESLNVKSRGGFLTLDGDGNYKFEYRQQPNTIKDDDMRVDGYHIFNNINPLPVSGQVEGAKWLKVSRLGLYVYAYVSIDGIDWEPIGKVGYSLYPETSAKGESYFLDNNWNLMKTPGEFYLPMADTIYVGVASSGGGEADHITLTGLGTDDSLPAKVNASITSDSVKGTITINWKHVLKASYYKLYRTQDAEASANNPVADQRWKLVGDEIKDIQFTDADFKTGSNGPVYYKLVAFNANHDAGQPSDLLTGDISIEGLEFPTSVWKSLDTFTPTAGYDQMTGSKLRIYSDGLRFWNTDGNSYRFVYQEIPAQTEGTFITRVDKSLIIGEHLGEALLIRNNIKTAYDSSTYHRSARINTTKGIFAEGQQSGRSSRYNTDNTAENQNVWLRLDTHDNSETIDVYYAPATGTETSYPTDWTLILSFDKNSSTTSDFWKDMGTGTDGKWFVGMAFAPGGNMAGTNFYNIAPIFEAPKVSISGNPVESTRNITVKEGTLVTLELSAKDAFGINNLPVADIQAAGTLPDGVSFDAEQGLLTWTPQVAGTYTLPFKVQDKSSLNDFYGGMDIKVTVMPNTVIPVFEPIADNSYYAEAAIDFNVKAAVKDTATAGDPVKQETLIKYDIKSVTDSKGIVYTEKELGIVFNKATGHFKWTPTKLLTGIYNITFLATDGEYTAEDTAKITVHGAPLIGLPESYKSAIEAGETIEIMAEDKILLPLTVNDPTGRAYYNYLDEIPAGANYNAGTLAWTPKYDQSTVSDPVYTFKLVAYNSRFKNELSIKFKVITPKSTAPQLIQKWNASALSEAALSALKYSYSGGDNSEVAVNNNAHQAGASYNQGTGRTSFIYQKLNSDAEIIARIAQYDPASKYAGVMVSDYYGIDPTSTGINKAADTVFMALSSTEYLISNTQAGRFKTNSVLAFARNNVPTNGDYANMGFGTGETDVKKTYWVKLKYSLGTDGSATVQGYYRVDGTEQWTTDDAWKYIYSKAQVDKGLYIGLMASPSNKEVKFDQARVSQETVSLSTFAGSLTEIPVSAAHPYEKITYSYTLSKDGVPFTDAAVSTKGLFSWIPTDGGTYELTITATANTSGEAVHQKYAISVYKIDKTALGNLIQSVEGHYSIDYTSDSWNTFANALVAANQIMLNLKATQAEIDSALTALSVAVKGLTGAKQAVAEKDTYIHSGAVTTNYGSAPTMVVLRNSSGIQRLGLVTFDLSKFMGKELSSANLKIYNSSSNTARQKDMNAYLVDFNEWDEKSVTYNAFAEKYSGVTDVTYLADFLRELPVSSLTLNLNEAHTGVYGAWNGDIKDLIEQKLKNSDDTKLTLLLSVLPGTTNETNPVTKEFAAAGVPAGTYAPQITVDFAMQVDDLLNILDSVASGYRAEDFTANSWSSMTSAVTGATTVVQATYASQAEINQAYAAFRPAFLGLVNIADLNSSIAVAEGLESDDYTAGSWIGLSSSLVAAQTVQQNAAATKAEVEVAVAALKNAMNELISVAELRILVKDFSTYNNDEGEYTKTSWAAAQLALTDAKALLSEANASQGTLKAAYVRLKAAIESLEDASKLRDLVVRITSSYQESEYTAASWLKISTALNIAVDILFDGDADNVSITSAYDSLSAAEKGLVSTVTLQTAIVQAGKIKNNNTFTELTWSTFTARFNLAKELLHKASQPDQVISKSKISATVSALLAAQAALLTSLDFEELAARLNQVADLDESSYSSEGWNLLLTAVTVGQEIQRRGLAGDELLTQAEVDTATESIGKAINGLVLKDIIKSKELLAKLIEAAALEQSKYTKETWSNLVIAISQAEAVKQKIQSGDKQLTQEEVDTAVSVLKNAINDLVLKSTDNSNGNGDGDGNNSSGSNGISEPITPTTVRNDQRLVTENDWKALLNGKLTLDLAADVKEVILPLDAPEHLGTNLLQIRTYDGLMLDIPSSVLAEIVKLSEGKGSKLIIRLKEATTSVSESVLANDIGYKLNGKIYDISLILMTEDGDELHLSKTNAPVKLSLSINQQQANEELVGIYYFSDSNEKTKYYGGTVEGKQGLITISITQFGLYGLMEYSKQFTDVPNTHWAAQALKVMVSRHIVNGSSEVSFTPNGETSRAEFVAMLVRLLQLTAEAGETPFADVHPSNWYAKDVTAAYKSGLINGMTDTAFMPNRQITREEMAVLALRAYNFARGRSNVQATDLSMLKDEGQVSAWAASDVAETIQLKLMQGTNDNQFQPKKNATRAETVQMLYNLLQAIR